MMPAHHDFNMMSNQRGANGAFVQRDETPFVHVTSSTCCRFNSDANTVVFNETTTLYRIYVSTKTLNAST